LESPNEKKKSEIEIKNNLYTHMLLWSKFKE